MKATLQTKDETTNYVFSVKSNGKTYRVKIYLNSKGKFIDDEISRMDGEPLEYQGEEGEIREKIIDYLDKNWDTLVGQ